MARPHVIALKGATVWTLALALSAIHSTVPAPAHAQDTRHRYTVDESSSLAWWQISPHLDHLWATTCPQEPNWQPGSERGTGWAYDASKAPKTGHAAIVDTIHVPIYPRLPGTAQPICSPAVRGEIVASDTSAWRGVRGLIMIRADQFITGLGMRDEFAKRSVLQASMYPDIRFRLDSLTEVQSGDTIRAKAVGLFVFHGITEPKVVPVKAWREAGGLRVTGKFDLEPTELVEKYKVSRLVLGLGVGTAIWKYLHLGFDVVLQNSAGGGPASQP